ncbi:hypothetical protein CAter282_3752 [Collimonas arenae]|uniref:Uncharacterized protein n=1 Tax=Collimonas arenae TaxID=279058 RepID=A0A127PUU5_9BURK|nr:hypothetical protein CAter10_4100 [Collimonas arenae]AMP11430.1 hypothetical protein CAter282_3752 [Collimonas arenae]
MVLDCDDTQDLWDKLTKTRVRMLEVAPGRLPRKICKKIMYGYNNGFLLKPTNFSTAIITCFASVP